MYLRNVFYRLYLLSDEVNQLNVIKNLENVGAISCLNILPENVCLQI